MLILGPKFGFTFIMRRIADTAVIYRAQQCAAGFIIVPNALGAQRRINLVYELAHVDRIVWASGLTNVTIDALIGDDQCQLVTCPKLVLKSQLNDLRYELSHISAETGDLAN